MGSKAETGKLDEQADRSHKKVLGLQEYRDQRKNKKEVAEVAESGNNQEEEDWDADVIPPRVPHCQSRKIYVSSTKILELN